MNRLSLLSLTTAVLVSACSAAPSRDVEVAGAVERPVASPAAAIPMPPQRECLFPTPLELADLASRSELILLGRIATPGLVLHPDSGPVTQYTIYPQNMIKPPAVEVLDREVDVELPEEIRSIGVPIQVTGGVPTRLLDVGTYVLYLKHPGRVDPRGDRVVSALRPDRPYYVTDGMFGTFPVRELSKEDPTDQRVHRECPNYEDPSTPIVAKDLPKGMPLGEFLEIARDSADRAVS